MLNKFEFKQASIKKAPSTNEVFILNQSSPVYVKADALLTGDDIISAEFKDDNIVDNSIAIGLTSRGMKLINNAAQDKDYPMLVFLLTTSLYN